MSLCWTNIVCLVMVTIGCRSYEFDPHSDIWINFVSILLRKSTALSFAMSQAMYGIIVEISQRSVIFLSSYLSVLDKMCGWKNKSSSWKFKIIYDLQLNWSKHIHIRCIAFITLPRTECNYSDIFSMNPMRNKTIIGTFLRIIFNCLLQLIFPIGLSSWYIYYS